VLCSAPGLGAPGGAGGVARPARCPAKDVDGDPDEDYEDAANADHREHPVVHDLPVWVVPMDPDVSSACGGLEGGVGGPGQAGRQVGGGEGGELGQVAGGAGAPALRAHRVGHRPAGGAAPDYAGLAAGLHPEAVRPLAVHVPSPDDPLVLVAGVGQAGPALLHVRRAQPVGRHRRLHYGPATHRGTQ